MAFRGNKLPTIAVIGAHHDDVELRCGGTLAKYIKDGCSVVYAVATSSPNYFPKSDKDAKFPPSNAEIVELRKEESKKASATLGISDITFFDFKCLYWYEKDSLNRKYFDSCADGVAEFNFLKEEAPGRELIMNASFSESATERICDFLESKRPDVVLTHFPDDGHPEHYATALLVHKCVCFLYEKNIRMNLLAWEPGPGGTLTPSFLPTHFIDITGTIDLKCKALEQFPTQLKPGDEQLFTIRARKRAKETGAFAGMEYAEPFMEFLVPRQSSMDVWYPNYQDHKTISDIFITKWQSGTGPKYH